jgi:hypothetical protein
MLATSAIPVLQLLVLSAKPPPGDKYVPVAIPVLQLGGGAAPALKLPPTLDVLDRADVDVAPAANVSHYNPWVMLVHTAVLEYHLNTTMHDKGPPVVTARVQDSRYVKFSTVLFQEK